MIQGCGSNVGKSLLVAGLARVFARRGMRVAPFKPQNMSNNAAVTDDGGEIGRAQALQARAAGVPLSRHMNPVLLKPETDIGAQVIVQGRRLTSTKASDYAGLKPRLMDAVRESYAILARDADLVIVEGAGSPAEINLRANDIANMGFARAENVPVILAGDIDRGGVIAQIVGTQAVIDPLDAALIKGFLINKFRGDPRLFDDGYAAISKRTGWPGLGVIPWFDRAHHLPAEDALDLPTRPRPGRFRVVVPILSRIANFDDLDPLALDPALSVEMIAPGRPLPLDADLVILPGTKSTRGDLAFLRAQGWDIDLAAILRRGGRALGLCGGYQMLGRTIADPDGIEGEAGSSEGLSHLAIDTVMSADKRLARVEATHLASGCAVSAYEIHIGASEGPDRSRPLFSVASEPEGAVSADGRVMGTYLHGLFAQDDFRRAFLASLGASASDLAYDRQVDETLDALADHLERHVDCDAVLAIAKAAGG
ncbi:MAG: cobyric acid synthase [Salinarimonadaceae bacterium]|nr:MAG: cobyric acid synthase [Salinarimonadaceae bacterium]